MTKKFYVEIELPPTGESMTTHEAATWLACELAGEITDVTVWDSDEMRGLLTRAMTDLVGVLPEFETSGDRRRPAWQTLQEICDFLGEENPLLYGDKTFLARAVGDGNWEAIIAPDSRSAARQLTEKFLIPEMPYNDDCFSVDVFGQDKIEMFEIEVEMNAVTSVSTVTSIK